MIVFITPFAVNEESVLSIPITLSPFSKVPLIESISNYKYIPEQIKYYSERNLYILRALDH